MASTYDKASLVMIPSGIKEGKLFSQKPVNGDGDFTFSRSTAATRVNADGNIEKETQNLLTYSNDFNNWNGTSGATLTPNQAGYDGTNDAWLVTDLGYTYQNSSVTGVHTYSLYAKAGTGGGVRLRIDQSGSDTNGYFNLNTGSVYLFATGAYGIDANIESVGGGWYRCSVSWNATDLLNVRFYVTDGAQGGTAGETIYIQDAQLEQGLVARDYIETTTAAVEGGITDNVPRLDYTDSSCPALLLEPQRTNSLPDSELFAGSNWSRLNVTSVSNNSLSPEGVSNASLIYPTTSGTDRLVEKVLSAQAGVVWTSSFFVKASGFDWVLVYAPNLGIAYFNASTGQFGNVANGVTAKVLGQHNGFWRVSFTGVIGGSNTYFYAGVADANGTNVATANGTDGILIYGAQLEQGSYATSYIPTYGTSVTRNGDDARKTSIGSLLNTTEGTLFAEYTQTLPITSVVFQISVGNNSDRVQIENGSSGAPLLVVSSGGTTQAVVVNPAQIPVGELRKVAVTYKQNEFKLYVNGVLTGTDTSGAVPTSLTAAYIGSEAGIPYAGFKVNQLLYIPSVLTDQEAIDLTTI